VEPKEAAFAYAWSVQDEAVENRAIDGLLSDAFLAGVRWADNQFKVHGTDGCSECETGRTTLYVLDRRCITCRAK
jgi:hypothetical protein